MLAVSRRDQAWMCILAQDGVFLFVCFKPIASIKQISELCQKWSSFLTFPPKLEDLAILGPHSHTVIIGWLCLADVL